MNGNRLLERFVELLELPPSAYEKAEERYQDLGAWLERPESTLRTFDPHVFPQGSFRLGTAIRPLHGKEEYDLDLACKIRSGISKATHTQKALKDGVGYETELFRVARGVESPLKPKHRCWRIEYQDKLKFHIDVVPCIPADEQRVRSVYESMTLGGMDQVLAQGASELTVSITDDRLPNYEQISSDWNISNPEGYAVWFENQMKSGMPVFLEGVRVDSLPIYKKKAPLQRVVQILKRHRDQMFRNRDDSKPISIIITTLAGRAYQGEQDLAAALTQVLERMGSFVGNQQPRVPNPVDPGEDFADRWAMTAYRHLQLEENFWAWLVQAKADIRQILESRDSNFLAEKVQRQLALTVSPSSLDEILGLTASSSSAYSPRIHQISSPAKPWRR